MYVEKKIAMEDLIRIEALKMDHICQVLDKLIAFNEDPKPKHEGETLDSLEQRT